MKCSLTLYSCHVWVLTKVTVITSQITVYDTGYIFDVTAGVGVFNASLIQPFTESLQSSAPQYPYEVLPYSYSSMVNMLVVDPLLSTVSDPVGCSGDYCASYLMTGGLEMMTPWLPNDHLEYSMARINSAPSIQLDVAATSNSVFLDSNCDVFGEDGFVFGIRLCVAEDEFIPGFIQAGTPSQVLKRSPLLFFSTDRDFRSLRLYQRHK